MSKMPGKGGLWMEFGLTILLSLSASFIVNTAKVNVHHFVASIVEGGSNGIECCESGLWML